MTEVESTINMENLNLEGDIETQNKANSNSNTKSPPKSDSAFNFGYPLTTYLNKY